MRKNKILPVLASLLIISLALPMLAIFAGAEDSYELSRPGSSHNQTLDAKDIIELYLGYPVCDEEGEYLKLYNDFSLSYDNGITTSNVICDFSDGVLTVFAEAYTYVSAAGVNVEWIPARVTLGNRSSKLVKTADHYEASFTDVVEGEIEHVSVDFVLELSVKKDDFNSLLNHAYENAPIIKAQIIRAEEEYVALKNKYDSDKISYDRYLAELSEYEAALVVYRKYLSDKLVYDEAFLAYQTYLSEKAAYEKALLDYANYEVALEEYNSLYADYRIYLQNLDEYNAKNKLYEDYVKKMELLRNQLGALDHNYTYMTSYNRDVYHAITGPLVTSVLENKDLITSELVNVDKEVVDSAGIATENLRSILIYYRTLYKEGNEIDKYTYYTINYEAIRDNFVLLLQCLDNLYSNKRIRAEIIRQEKQQKYLILVAQLYVIANALTDGTVYSYYGDYAFDSSYRLEKQTVAQILENNIPIVDTENAAPLSEGYPQAVEQPTKPETVTEPIKPTPVRVPAKPEVVTDPGAAPTPVDEPIKPETVADPGKEPEKYVPQAELAALVKAYEEGRIVEREELSKDFTFSLTETVRKGIFNVTSATVAFCSPDGNVIYKTTVDSGTRADFIGDIPTKEEDASATYVFDGWQDSDGILADLTSVSTDLILYPKFKAITKYYDVTFDVDGVKTVVSTAYGEIPLFDQTPIRPDDSTYEYSFVGWDRELAPVTEAATYKAVFDGTYILPFVNGGGASISFDDANYYADCNYASIPTFDLSGLIRRATEGEYMRGIVLESRFCKLVFSYSTILSMKENGDFVISPTVMQSGVSGYSYSLKITDGQGNVSNTSYRVVFSAPCAISEIDDMLLSYLSAEGERVYCNFTFEGGMISFSMNTGIKYSLLTEYKVNLIQSSIIELTLSQQIARPDELIYVRYEVPAGVSLEKVFYVDSNGNETIIENGRFRMPKSDVTVGVVCSYIEYKITFMNGKNVIATYNCHYGDLPVAPKDPSKLPDKLYSYNFIGWSDEIVPVTEDKVYSAVYRADLLPPKEEPTGIQISEGILRLIIAGIVGLCMLLFVVIPSSIMSVIVVKKAKKGYLKRNK